MVWYRERYRHLLAAKGIKTSKKSFAIKYYKVGGAVRDELMNRAPKDIDVVAVGANKEYMMKRFGEPKGEDFPVFIGKVPGHSELGVVEIAMARKESKIPEQVGHRAFKMEFGPDVTLLEDLKRRDLTINAMAKDLETGELIDPYGGQEDIRRGLLRHVNEEAFGDDPQRIFRLARMRARFGFDVDPETMRLAEQAEIMGVPDDEIGKETMKAIGEKYPSLYFRTLEDAGKLQEFFPQLAALKGVPHRHEEDAFEHQLMALDKAAEYDLPVDYRFAVGAHDWGKGETPESELPRHIGHEKVSAQLVKEYFKRYPYNAGTAGKTAEWFAKNHMRLHKIDDMGYASLADLAEEVINKRLDPKLINIASRADAMGRIKPVQNNESERLQKAVDIISKVGTEDIRARGFTGPKIGALHHQAKVEALRRAGV